MEESKKKLADLTIEEALKYTDELVLKKKGINVTIADFKAKKSKLRSEKKGISEAKSKRLKDLQDSINKTTAKSIKESKQKSKKRESESFDSKAKSKDREIDSLSERIAGLEKGKKEIDVGLEMLKQHINKLKS